MKRKVTNKRVKIEVRCSNYEKKLLIIKAKKAGLSLSEFTRRAVFDKSIKERLSEEQIEIFKELVKFHNNLKRVGNLLLKKEPNSTLKINLLADELKCQFQKFK